MEFDIITYIAFLLTGLFVGSGYALISKNNGLPVGKSFFYAITGAFLGGVLSILFNLGGTMIMAVVFSAVVLFLGHLMARQVQAESKRKERLEEK